MAKLENKAKENLELEQNTLSDGRISLYLEYYLGREETPVLDKNGILFCMKQVKRWVRPRYTLSTTGERIICSCI